MRAAEFMRGSVRAEISGVEPERCLNALTLSGIAFREAVSEDAFTLRLSLDTRDAAEAARIAERSQCALRLLRESGVPAVRRRLRRRAALLAAAGLCFALLAAGSLFAWEIDVVGEESVTEGEIRRALAACGVYPGSFWPGWDADAVCNRLLLELPELSWAGLSVSGSRAEVRVRERIEKPPIVSEEPPGGLFARSTGIIERMEVLAGAPLVSEGEAVVEGEALVTGELPSPVGETRYVRAQAKVTARTWHELSACAPLEYSALSEAGTSMRWALEICGRRVNFFFGSSQTPPGCGKIITEYPLRLEGVFTLPLTLIRERVLRYDAAPAAADTEALTAELSEQLLTELRRRLDGGEVLNYSVSAA